MQHRHIATLAACLLSACADDSPAQTTYPDGRPAASLRLEAKDQGVVLRHGDGPGQCDLLGAREALVCEENGVYHLFYDGAGPRGWRACLATSRDLATWEKKGPLLDFGKPGEDDSAAACSPWVHFDGKEWHMFYLGTPNASRPPDRIPGFPYLTLKARSRTLAGPWVKQPEVVPFRPRPDTYYSMTASPGQVVRHEGEYLQFFSSTAPKPGNPFVQRTLGIARTRDLNGTWTADPEPIVPIEEQIENSSLYFEPSNKTWFLFTNHIGLEGREYTDAIWVYWTMDLNKWDPADKAVVLDGKNCLWSKKCIGMPSVIQAGNRLAVFYDAPGGDGTGHMKRDIGLAWLELPLTPPGRTPPGGAAASPDDAWLQKAKAHLLTPASDHVAPAHVTRTEGRVEAAEAFLREDGRSGRLTFDKGGPRPVAILDFGKQSAGGYAVFTVTARTGLPVVRLAYADHPDGLSETGDFSRKTSARYLGPAVDLPVLPGNVNRHETYTIPRTGRFIAPLIQGQARYVRLQLDSPDTSVDIDSVEMVNSNVHDRSPTDGAFLCGDERLNRLWYISTWTLQIASFPNHDAWKTVGGWLLPRKLEMADDLGLSVDGGDWGDVTIDTTFELRANPHHVSAAGIAFRARDARNAYLAELGLDGAFRLIRRQEGRDHVISEQRLPAPLIDGTQHHLEIDARGPVLTTRLDGATIDETRDTTFATGRVGFYTPKEKWPLFDAVRVTAGTGKVLLADDFSGDLTKWSFARTLSFVADGAKRDRLVWSGDLYFAQRSAYYGSAHPTYLRDSIKMLAFNQTPEGYVHASPYPERSVPPPSNDYGPFPSDEFAAWLVPVAWQHLLYTDDTDTLREVYPAIKRLLGYLGGHMGSNGLFVQQKETSKHAGNLNLGDVRTRSYMNILLWGAYSDAARIADRLGLAGDRTEAQAKAEALKQALFTRLWDGKNGYFKEAVETPGFGPEANALALSMGLVTPGQARGMTPHFKRIPHGKFQSLASRGLFEYGFAQSGLDMLLDHNWLKLLEDGWEGPATTTECMNLPTKGWGDNSHPDTAIADHLSAYLLGVKPSSPGYATFTVAPQPTREVRWARGIVPTPHGPITVMWEVSGDALNLSLTVPAGTTASVLLPEARDLTVNGRPGSCQDLKAGVHHIEARGLPGEIHAAPPVAPTRVEKGLKPVVTASSSHEQGGWGITSLLAPPGQGAGQGYSSKPHAADQAEEWLEFDLGGETTLAKIVLIPRADMPASGFPRDFKVQLAKQPGRFTTVADYTDCPVPDARGLSVDLSTVIGFPSARYVRIAVTRLGAPAADEPGVHRLQFSRVRLLQP